MTDYGLQVYNNEDILVIDSKYKNHIYHSHGTSFLQQYMNVIDIPDLTSTGVIFVKPTSFLTKAFGFEKNGNVYDKILIASDSTGYIDWIVYEDIQTEPSGNYGFNVYDSSATIVFSSLETGYLNIVQDYYYSQQQKTVHDAYNNYFAMIGCSLGYSVLVVWSGGTKTVTYTRQITGLKYVDSNTLDFSKFIFNIEVEQSSEAGGGSFMNSGSSSSVPQKLIELKKPPSI